MHQDLDIRFLLEPNPFHLTPQRQLTMGLRLPVLRFGRQEDG